ncbi:MAG: sterol desaturase family protein [Saprospiraceae bacterium]|nr:sterol desaturase family protein [Saprospiraceae bacterium]
MLDIIHISIPFFIILLLAEVALAYYEKKDWYETTDTFSSLAMGVGNVIIGLFTKSLIFLAFSFMYQFRIFEMGNSWWSWILLFIADDFSYYWFHRTAHNSRYFWASHVVHHSSQKYNLGTALRQTWTGNLSGSFVFWMWMPIVGFTPEQILTMQAISLLYQFWIHTEAIYKFPRPIEFIFNTPSHHRVHHGSDLEYLDMNHGGILIIWDRLFGTFIEENKHPVYGLTKNIETRNPFKIAFHEWVELITDVAKSKKIYHSFMYIFGPPGWSPDGSSQTTKQLRQSAINK